MKTALISGAGIAGTTLAFWLKAAGFGPTLIERAPALRTGGYVIDFWGLGYDIAERMGLLGEINRIGYHVREMRIVDDQGRRQTGFGTKIFDDLTGGRYVTLQRSDLSRLLFAKVQGQLESIFGDEVVAVEERPDCVRVELKHAGERRFDLLIGADGLHSAVRKLAFAPQSRFERHLGYVVAAFEARGYRPRDEDVYLLYGRPGRMVGRFTLREDRTLFLMVFVPANADFPATPDAQKALLRAVYAKGGWECSRMLEELGRVDELYFDKVSQIKMPNWASGRVALVGDAAFCVSLLAGQGSALAMISAYVLAGELAKVADADRELEEQFKRNPTLKAQIARLEVVYSIRFSSAATKFVELLMGNLSCFSLNLWDEWGEIFVVIADLGFFCLTGDRYQMTLPKEILGLKIEAALLRLAATEDEEYFLHPEHLVTCLSKSDVEHWQLRLEGLPWLQRVADRAFLLGENHV